MVGTTPEPSFDYSRSYVDAVKEAFQDEPAKYDEFKKLLNDFRAKRVDSGSLIASVEELMRNHSKLLPGFSVFHQIAKRNISSKAKRTIPLVNTTIPPEVNTTLSLELKTTIPPDVNRTIPPEPNKTLSPEPIRTIFPDANEGLGQSNSMVAERVSSSHLTMDDSRAYVAAVKEAFKDEPKKYDEFLQILKYIYTHKDEEAHCYAGIKELMKDHPNLLVGFNVFLPPESKITIPPVSDITKPISAMPLPAMIPTPPEVNANGPPKVKVKIVLKCKRTIPPEDNRTIPPKAQRTIITEGKTAIPTEAKKTMGPEGNAITLSEYKIIKAKRSIHPEAETNCTKRKLDGSDVTEFLEKLKTRFRTLDTHKVESFCEIMTEFRKGKKPKEKVHREVVDLLYYHEDLIEDFSRFFTRKHTISTR